MVVAGSFGRVLRVAALTMLVSVSVAVPSAVAEPALPDEGAITSALTEGYEAHQQEQQRHEELLADPESVAQRENSKQAYADFGPAEAEALLRSVFGSVLDSLNQDPARFLSDAKVDYVAEEGAATVTSEGDTQLLETSIPIQVEEENGELGKVDLTLSEGSEGWEPENPLVELAVGDTADEGVELGDEGLTITQVGAEEAAAQPLGDKNLFFPEIDEGTDTDLVVSPVSSGVEMFDLLRSADSPETLRFHLDLPQGSELRAGPNGIAEVVDGEGKASALIPKPWAMDAQETRVPVEMTVEGDDLVLSVEHRDQDLAYPIIVDPTIYQDWGWWYQGQHLSGIGAWRWQQSAGAWWVNHGYEDTGFPGYENKGLFIATSLGTLQGQQWGQWIYSAPNPGSYLASATINPFWRNNRQCASSSYYYPYDYAGMWIESSGWHQLNFNNANDLGYSNLNQWGEAVIIGMSTDASTNTYMPCWRDLMIGGVGIWLDDWQVPWMTILAPPPSTWVKRDATARTVEIKGTDEGLGVQRIRMYSGSKEWNWDQPFCAGTYEDRCATERTGKISYTTESVGAEGKVNVGFQVIDPTDKRGTVERTLMIDGTAPTVSLSGELQPSAYKLNVEAKDGSSTEPRSGVKEVKVYLDGALKETRASSCTSAGCPATVSFTYNQSLSGLAVGKHTLEVIATDQVGYTKSATTSFTIEAPDTIIDSGPEGLTNDSTPSFTYHSTLSGSTFQCSVDGAPYAGCPGTGYTTPVLTEGSHTFSVKAVSGAGNSDPTPASRTFTVDTIAPNTFIDFAPAETTNNTTPAFGYSSDDGRARFECKLDAAPFGPCGPSEYEVETPLADGSHTFQVRAIDLTGNVDATPASKTFTVDSAPPTLQIESGPNGPTNSPNPTFTFSSSGASSLRCAIDPEVGGPEEPSYGSCTTSTSYTPLVPLADGAYVFRVQASDAAGNRVTQERSFTVDTVVPQTTIDSGPSGTTDEAKPTFAFSSNESNASFKCRFDLEAFRACSGPGATDTPATALADGPHTFEVRASDAAGNTDATPASRSFTVSTGGPQTTITAGPSGAIGVTSATFKYTADEPATFQCRLDSAPFLSCPSSEKAYTGLTEGEHVFEVRGVNNALVVDPTPARRAFVVDTSAPKTPVVSGAVREPGVPGLTLRIEAKDGEASSAARRSGVETIKVFADGQLVETYDARCRESLCPATVVRTVQLPYPKVIGEHTFFVEAVDGLAHSAATSPWPENTPEAETVFLSKAKPEKTAPCPQSELSEKQFGQLNRIPVKRNQPVIVGSDQSDLIVSKPGVHTIKGRDGCDVIIGGPSREVIKAGAGNDVILGARSNDVIYGNDDNDHIYGGIGDDNLYGGPGADVVDGGPGADHVKGEGDTDTVRGGQGEDHLSGGKGEGDTLSYSDALAPGFAEEPKLVTKAKEQGIGNFPQTTESGIYMELTGKNPTIYAGRSGNGGGTDVLIGNGQFERIVGSAFSDWIEGNAGANKIDPGPGPDVVLSKGSATVDSDANDSVEHSPNAIGKRDSTKLTIGIQGHKGADEEADIYLIGSDGVDNLRIRVARHSVQFVAKSPETKAAIEPVGCGKLKGSTLTCKVNPPLGALALYGGEAGDVIRMQREEPKGPGAIEIDGGPGTDHLRGNAAGEIVIDGSNQGGGSEDVHGGGGDDAIIQGDGSDEASGDGGNDLVISSQICNNDKLYGDVPPKKEGSGGDKGSDNAQFHPLHNTGIYANLQEGEIGEEKSHKCSDGKTEPLRQFNDLEASPQSDDLIGSKTSNLLIGRGAVDQLQSRAGNDVINARDDKLDDPINCGPDDDEAHVNSQKEKRKARSEGCEVANFKGPKYVRRPGLAYDRESEPLSLGEVVMPSAQPGPISYYDLDESEGTTALNSVDEAPNGTYKAAGFGPSVNGPGPTLGAEGAMAGEEEGTGVKFDGVDDYVDLAGQGLPESEASGYALEMFVKLTGTATQREFLFSGSEGSEAGEGIFLYREPGGRLVFATGLEQGAPKIKAPNAITDQQWHQVVAWFEGENLALNVDGFPYQLGFGENVMPKALKSPQSLLGAGPGPAHFLAASIDEVGFFEGSIGESEALEAMGESSIEEPEYLLSPAPETADNDGDGVTDGADNCPSVSNSNQADVDMDGIGDACEPPDADGDDIPDTSDNCPYEYNPEQIDSNGDGIGDECTGMPPEVETGAASSVTGSSATLNGTVDPEASETTYQFEYGSTTAYGSKAPVTPASAGAGATPIAVSQPVSGLAPNTTYHYRLVATNEAGETEGADATFTTPKAPTVTTRPASSITSTSVVLNADVNPEGSATTYQFEYGKTTAYGSKAPASAESAGSGTSLVSVKTSVSKLEANTIYHYRVVATNAAGTSIGNDGTVKTASPPVVSSQVTNLRITETFDGGTSSQANFNSLWTTLGWAGGTTPKGAVSYGGWHPYDAFSTVNGASYNTPVYDTGSGVATMATLVESPALTERYFSLWLDMSNPSASTKAGYELRFTDIAANTYKVTISKWVGGKQTVLATQPSFGLPVGGTFALVDQGESLTAWANTGSGLTQMLSAGDDEFSGGKAGIEGSGNFTLLSNFRVGVPQTLVSNMDAALKALPLNDPFSSNEMPLSFGGAWAALQWDNSTSGTNTGQVQSGWGPYDAFPTINGAYWQRGIFSDTGSGNAVAATLTARPSLTERYFALWLDMPAPGSVRSGYELRFMETGSSLFTVTLSRWQSGTKTVLSTKTGYSFPAGGQFALVEKGGTVSAWTSTGGEFSQILAALDSTFVSGYTGVEASGNFTRLSNFRAGALSPF